MTMSLLLDEREVEGRASIKLIDRRDELGRPEFPERVLLEPSRPPELQAPEAAPSWFCAGHKFTIQIEDEKNHLLSLRNGSAHLSIMPAGDAGWLMKYHNNLSAESDGLSSFLEGRVYLDTSAIRSVFGLPPQNRTEEHQDEARIRSQFIRSGNFLNVPGPGSGQEGDANISIYITQEIKDAVMRLLAPHS
jgi:hypothetical protein